VSDVELAYAVGQTVEVTAIDVAQGGWCVARPEGLPVLFVRHALPGERVLARVTEVTSRFARADAIEVREASPDRVEPPCPNAHPGGCGGCDWQHASLPAQRALKAAVIAQQLRRVAGLELDGEITVEALPGDEGSTAEALRAIRVEIGLGETMDVLEETSVPAKDQVRMSWFCDPQPVAAVNPTQAQPCWSITIDRSTAVSSSGAIESSRKTERTGG